MIHCFTIRQVAKLVNISNKINIRNPTEAANDNILRTGDTATATFEFCYQPEYLKIGIRIVLCEGRTKIIGIITKC